VADDLDVDAAVASVAVGAAVEADIPAIRIQRVQPGLVLLQLINPLIRCVQALLQGVTFGGESRNLTLSCRQFGVALVFVKTPLRFIVATQAPATIWVCRVVDMAQTVGIGFWLGVAGDRHSRRCWRRRKVVPGVDLELSRAQAKTFAVWQHR
jgi:hypothetical protein